MRNFRKLLLTSVFSVGFVTNSWGAVAVNALPGAEMAATGVLNGLKNLQDKDLLTGLKGLKSTVANMIYALKCKTSDGNLMFKNATAITDKQYDGKNIVTWFTNTLNYQIEDVLNIDEGTNTFKLILQLDAAADATEKADRLAKLKKILGFDNRAVKANLSGVSEIVPAGGGAAPAREDDHKIQKLSTILTNDTIGIAALDNLVAAGDPRSFNVAKNQTENDIQTLLPEDTATGDDHKKQLQKILKEIDEWDLKDDVIMNALSPHLLKYLNGGLLKCNKEWEDVLKEIYGYYDSVNYGTASIANIKTFITACKDYFDTYIVAYKNSFDGAATNAAIGDVAAAAAARAADADGAANSADATNAAADVGVIDEIVDKIQLVNIFLAKGVEAASSGTMDAATKKTTFARYTTALTGAIDNLSTLLTNDNNIKAADLIVHPLDATGVPKAEGNVTLDGFEYLLEKIKNIPTYKPDTQLPDDLQNMLLTKTNVDAIMGAGWQDAMQGLRDEIVRYLGNCKRVEEIIANGATVINNSDVPLVESVPKLEDQQEMVDEGQISSIIVHSDEYYGK